MHLIRVLIFSLLICTPAPASTTVGPLLMFELFERTTPEVSSVFRLGYGVGAAVDVVPRWVAADTAVIMSSNTDSFPSENFLDERVFRASFGVLSKVLQQEIWHLGLKFGAQYSLTTTQYTVKVLGQRLTDRVTYWSPYLGLEGMIRPLSGFGVRESVVFLYDKRHTEWVTQILLGVAL